MNMDPLKIYFLLNIHASKNRFVQFLLVYFLYKLYLYEFWCCMSPATLELSMPSNWRDLRSEDIERMKRVRLHRGLRHYWGILAP